MGTCCMCEKYKWPDPQEVVWRDPADRKEYCVFHAPRGEKWESLGGSVKYTDTKFNALVFSRIAATKRNIALGDIQACCILRGVVIPCDISFQHFSKDNPLPCIDFSEATFSGEAEVIGATFSGKVTFVGAMFSGKVTFVGAAFRGEANFIGATFSDVAMFHGDIFSGEATFLWATFRGAAIFISATFSGGAMFFEATFRSGADFHSATFSGGVQFKGATFGGGVSFLRVTFNDWAGFSYVKAKDNSLHLHSLSAPCLQHLQLTPLDLPAFSFLGCEWPDRLGTETHGDGGTANLKNCEDLYRAMKQRAAAAHDQPQVSHWHYREKLMAMKRGGDNIFDKIVLPIYYATSGFGERPVRSGLWLLGLMLLPLFVFALVKLAETGFSLRPDWKAVGDVFRDWQQALPLTKIPAEQNPSVWKLWVSYLSQLVILLQFTLFALAVRNRFRR